MRRSRGICVLFLALGFVLPAAPSVPDSRIQSFVAQQWSSLQPRKEERRFDEIGWVATLQEAKKLAAGHRRPIFVFTHDGRINTGRC